MLVLTALMRWFVNNWGNLASVIGLAVSIIVAFNVRSLRRHYNFVGRSDGVVERLREHSNELTACLNDFNGAMDQVSAQVEELRATLELLQRISPPEQQKEIKLLIKKIRSYRVQSKSGVWDIVIEILPGSEKRSEAKGLRTIYNKLLYIIQVTKDAQDNTKWNSQ